MSIKSSYCRKRFFKISMRAYSTIRKSNLKRGKLKEDIIGPADPISNLRPIIFAKSEKESELEILYRKTREETQSWNHSFWTAHNVSFKAERQRFQETLKANGKLSLTADDMSVFYKQFLDKNWQKHFNYNVLWYRKNIKILFLEIRIRLSKLKFK